MSTVLVVEDSLTDKEVLKGCLQQSGISVLTAQTAEEAFDCVKQHQFDVIILDVVLPDRSGYEICRELKAEAETSNIPVIICSTKGSDMDKFWGMKQGADAYLSKPIDQAELVRTVKELAKD
ncbi:MAG TPA: response regulator [Trichocoleus sp.]|jgi:DNA-binding response OmpR family regulator